MSHTRRHLSDQEREQRRAEQRELVKASIEQLRSSEGWQAYLRARRRLHKYSPGNVLLILLQHETAETVAGFQAWLKLGYCVRKGEHSIKIWAPCPPSKRQLQAWRDAGADPDERPRTRWRLASVFAQDQVDPLPPPAKPAPLTLPIRAVTGDSHRAADRSAGRARVRRRLRRRPERRPRASGRHVRSPPPADQDRRAARAQRQAGRR